jgi:hypothetical protein
MMIMMIETLEANHMLVSVEIGTKIYQMPQQISLWVWGILWRNTSLHCYCQWILKHVCFAMLSIKGHAPKYRVQFRWDGPRGFYVFKYYIRGLDILTQNILRPKVFPCVMLTFTKTHLYPTWKLPYGTYKNKIERYLRYTTLRFYDDIFVVIVYLKAKYRHLSEIGSILVL